MGVLSDTDCIEQRNILYWETASPRWELPEYVNAMALDVQAAKDWIAHSVIRTGGSSHAHAPKAASDGESEVDQSGGDHKEVPPSPGLARPKVQTKDLENIVLDKGPWAATPGVRQGWRIFVGVSSSPPVPPDILTDPQYTGPSGMARPDLPTVRQARACLFGTGGLCVWPVHARQKKVCQEVVVDGSFFFSSYFSDSEMTSRTSSCASSSSDPIIPPPPPPTRGKRAAKKGKAIPRRIGRP